MKRSIITIIISCLLIGTAAGYATGYGIYQPQIRNYEVQVSNLTAQLAKLEQTVSSQETRISKLESVKFGLETDLSQARAEIAGYKQQVTTLQAQVSNQQEQLTTLTSEKSSLQERLDKIFSSRLIQYYGWTYEGRTWQWELPIPLSLYVEYLERPRPQSPAYWVEMAKDPKDDPYIDQLIQQINSAALAGGFTGVQKLNFVIAFVQGLPYTVDIETTPFDEYPRYPIETLFDKGGDCEDTSILVTAILNKMGYDVALLLLWNAQHVAVGIALPDGSGSYYQYNNKKYFYLETTGDGWKIGEIPPDISDNRAQVYPLKS